MIIEGRGGKSIYEIGGSSKGMRPKVEGKVGMSEQSQAGFNYVSVTSFCIPIMLWSIWGRCEMRYAMGGEIRGKFFLFTTIIRENG